MNQAIRKVGKADALDVERARDLLSHSTDLDEVFDLHDKAVAIATYRRAQKAGHEAESSAAEIVVRCERRLGELLAAMPKAKGGGDKKSAVAKAGITSSTKAEVIAAPTIPSLGISHKESARFQKLASVPEKRFEAAIVEAKNKGKSPTSKAIIDAGKPKAEQRFSSATEIHTIYATLKRVAARWPVDESKTGLILILKQFIKELEQTR